MSGSEPLQSVAAQRESPMSIACMIIQYLKVGVIVIAGCAPILLKRMIINL
jgi:hypothetical protein